MIVKRINPISLAKVSAVLYAVLGLLLGCLFSLFAMLGSLAGPSQEAPILGLVFGAGAMVFLPVLYGAVGFVMSLIMAALYNLVAKLTGGVEVELEGTLSNGGRQGV